MSKNTTLNSEIPSNILTIPGIPYDMVFWDQEVWDKMLKSMVLPGDYVYGDHYASTVFPQSYIVPNLSRIQKQPEMIIDSQDLSLFPAYGER